MQKARRHHNKLQLRPLVSVWFQVLFTPLLGVLFTFPSRYWFTIGLSGVFSLARWCWQFHTEFHRFRATQDTHQVTTLHIRDYHPLWLRLPIVFYFCCFPLCKSYNPDTIKSYRFGLLRVRSPLLAESLLFSSPPGTEMFQFPGLSY